MMETVASGVQTAPVWLVLFLLVQSADAFTTAIDRSKGAIEAMPISAQLLHDRGVVLFWVLKLILALGIGAALLVLARWVARGRPGALAVYRYVILTVQVTTVVIAVVSLQNAVLRLTL
jgi:hypothetical protein